MVDACSPEELRLYDFPLGDVVLEEHLTMDKGEDGIPLSTSHLSLGPDVLPAYEKVCVGTTKFGMRSIQVSHCLVARVLCWSLF